MPHDEIKREQPMSPIRVETQISETTSTNPYSRAQNNGSIPQGSNSSNFKTASNVQNQRSHTVIKYEKNILISVGQPALKYINQNTSSRNLYSKSDSRSSSTHNAVQSSISRRRRSDKVGKGLRHFSMKVCEKVKEKGSTTYNEVADELVAEEVQSCEPFDSGNCDQKNIRRRVYDALNVLMAMNIILKDKKEIRWIGLPTNSLQQCNLIEKENQRRRERIDAKQKQLRELLLQQISFKSLVERNKEAERKGNIPTPNSSIQLPFIIVNTHKSAKVNCSVSADKSQYYFKFNEKFEIHDDVEVLKRMGFLLGLDNGNCSHEDIEKAKNLVPKNFEKYVEMYGRGEDVIHSDDGDLGYIEMVEPILHTGDRLSDECHIEDEILTDHSDGE